MQDQDEMKEIIVGLHRKGNLRLFKQSGIGALLLCTFNTQRLRVPGDWKGVVQLYENSKSLLTTDRIILWFQPSEKALAFLKENLKGVSGLLSIGTLDIFSVLECLTLKFVKNRLWYWSA